MTATLRQAYRGYTRVELIEKVEFKWHIKVLGCGAELYVYEDELIID